MSWLPLVFLRRAMREVEEAYENGQDERHAEQADRLDVDGAGRLQGTGVHHDTSPKSARAPILESTGPLLVISHGTATPRLDDDGRPIEVALLAAIRRKSGREASWHVLVVPDGGIWQSIPFVRAAWHAGSESAANVLVNGRRVAPNLCSIGIEYVNAGEVRLVEEAWNLKLQRFERAQPGWRAWPFRGQKPSQSAPKGRAHGKLIPEAELVAVGPRRWHRYTAAQFEARRRIQEAVLMRWPWLNDDVTLEHQDGRRVVVGALSCGHVDVDPSRKADPYPTFVTRSV